MTQLAKLGAMVTLLVIAFVATAHAECAWVLWQERPALSGSFALNDSLSVAFQTQQLCDVVAEGKNQGEAVPRSEESKRLFPAARWLCLPDTIDPRGPKAR